MAHRIIITDVCLVDGTHPPRKADVLVENNQFAAFERPGALTGLADAKVILGKGRFLLPGLWESHTHMMMGVGGSHAEKLAGVKAGLQSYLSRGVTSVVDLGCPEELMNEIRSDIVYKPHDFPEFYFAGPVFTGVNGWPLCMTCDHTSSWEITPESDIETKIAGLAPKTDFIKIIYDGVPDDGGKDKFPRSMLTRAIAAAHKHDRRVMLHARTQADMIEAIKAGADGIEHIFQPENPSSLKEAEEVADLMAANGVFFCPTLTTYEQIANTGSSTYLEGLRKDGIISEEEAAETMANPIYRMPFPRVSSDQAKVRLEYGLKALKVFAEKGVKLVAGSDVAIAMRRPGALLREMQLFEKAGLDLRTVIRSATRTAAERLGVSVQKSGFHIGSRADAILLRGNPLESLDALIRSDNVELVLTAGVAVGCPDVSI